MQSGNIISTLLSYLNLAVLVRKKGYLLLSPLTENGAEEERQGEMNITEVYHNSLLCCKCNKSFPARLQNVIHLKPMMKFSPKYQNFFKASILNLLITLFFGDAEIKFRCA